MVSEITACCNAVYRCKGEAISCSECGEEKGLPTIPELHGFECLWLKMDARRPALEACLEKDMREAGLSPLEVTLELPSAVEAIAGAVGVICTTLFIR